MNEQQLASGSAARARKAASEADSQAAAGDELQLEFRASPAPTVGIELELPIIDRESGELVPGSPRVLAACADNLGDSPFLQVWDTIGETGAQRQRRLYREAGNWQAVVEESVGRLHDELGVPSPATAGIKGEMSEGSREDV